MKIINIDVKDTIQLKSLHDTDTSTTEIINQKLKVPTGNINTILLSFDFIRPVADQEDLQLFAIFKTKHLENGIIKEITTIEVEGITYPNSCFIPHEIMEKEGEVTLGIYGYILNEDESFKKRLSLVPIPIGVVTGSYDKDAIGSIEVPEPTVFEVYFNKIETMVTDLETFRADTEEDINTWKEETKSEIEERIVDLEEKDSVVISTTEPTTGEEVWIQKSKNLFDKNKLSILGNTILQQIEDGFVVNGSGTWAQATFNVYLPAGKYTFSGAISGTIERVDIAKNGQYFTTIYPMDTFESDGAEFLFRFYATTTETSGSTSFQKIQLEQGEISTSYEPYIDKKIYTKNDNGVYEEFYREIESGSNENGSWIKYADGTIEQRGRLEIAANETYSDLVFPIPFVGDTNDIILSLANVYKGGGDYGGTQSIFCWASVQISTLNGGYIYSIYKDGEAPTFKRVVSYIAIGKWK